MGLRSEVVNGCACRGDGRYTRSAGGEGYGGREEKESGVESGGGSRSVGQVRPCQSKPKRGSEQVNEKAEVTWRRRHVQHVGQVNM